MAFRVSNWGARHGHALIATTGHLARHGVATLLTVVVLALALALPLALQVLVRNVRGATGDFADAVGISVYLKTDVSEARAHQLQQNANEHAGVGSATLITASQALAEFKAQSGFGSALDALTDNPLPNVLAIRPSTSTIAPAQLDALRDWFAAWPETDTVQLDRDWALRLAAMLELLRRVVLSAAVLLAAGVVAVIGNTIRLEILNRRAEIEVTKLVGGTNAFVRRPFLYAGVLYGLTGALLAWAVVAITRAVLAAPALNLASAYGSGFVLQGPSAQEFGTVVVAGVLLGWIGAFIAAARELSRIEPRVS